MRNLSAKPAVTKGEAAFGHHLDGGVLGCDLCPRFCELAPGERGWCGTRYNKNNRLWASNYGWLSLLQFDRVESVPLAEYANGGTVVKLGSFGCNFIPSGGERDLLKAESVSGRVFQPRDVAGICRNLVSQGCIGAAYVYAEPLLWYEFVIQTAMLLKKCDMRNIIATVGFINPRPLQELLPYLDAARFDLFAFDPQYYRDNLKISFASVLHSLKILADSPVHLEVSTPILFGKNDDPQMIGAIAAYLAKTYNPDLPYHLVAPKKELSPDEEEKIMTCADAAGRFLNRVYLS